MSGHTPGPWTFVSEMDDEDRGGFIGPNGEKVCSFGDSAQYYPTEGQPPSDADARLIAAAPDLLELLVEARKWMDGDVMNDPWEKEFTMKIDAVIAKAGGK